MGFWRFGEEKCRLDLRQRQTGSAAPGKNGGCKPRTLTGARRDWLQEREKAQFALRGVAAKLAERGVNDATDGHHAPSR